MAYLFLVFLTAISLFQISLIMGKPYGEYAWGGRHKVLPKNLRRGSLSSLFIYAFMALVTIEKSGIKDSFLSESFARSAMWFIFGYMVLGALTNAASRSKKERNVWTPILVVMSVITFLIAS